MQGLYVSLLTCLSFLPFWCLHIQVFINGQMMRTKFMDANPSLYRFSDANQCTLGSQAGGQFGWPVSRALFASPGRAASCSVPAPRACAPLHYDDVVPPACSSAAPIHAFARQMLPVWSLPCD